MAVLIAVVALLALSIPILAAVKVAVINHDGKPVSKAKIIATYSTSKGRETKSFVADSKGKLSIDLPTGDEFWCSITAIADGYSYGTTDNQPGASNESIITLYPEQKLKGKIVDEDGKPVKDAKVALDCCNAYDGNRSNWDFNPYSDELVKLTVFTTGKDGTFTLAHLPSPDIFKYGSVSLRISAKGRAQIRKNYQLTEIRNKVIITDPLECTVQGTVYLPGKTGTAPEGLTIGVHLASSEGGYETRGSSVGKDGKYSLSELPPGKVNIFLQRENGYRTGPNGPEPPEIAKWALPMVMGVELPPNQAATVDLVLAPGAIIRGTVIDKNTGKPLKNARLAVHHPGQPQVIPDRYITDDKGEFTFKVAAGEVSIEVEGIESESNYIYFQEEDRTPVTCTVADGEENTGFIVKVNPQESSQSMYDAAAKPIPKDLELTAGTYELSWDPEMIGRELECKMKYQGDQAKSRIKKLPDLISTKPMINAYSFDGPGDEGLLFVVLDESKGTGKGYDIAYIDVNRNSDLSDDQAVKWEGASDNYRQNTSWVSLPSHQGKPGGEQASNPVQMRLHIDKSGDQYFRATPERKGGWKGTIDSNKGKLECATFDSNGNGIYSDRLSVLDNFEFDWNSFDMLYADTNGFGRLALLSYGPHALRLSEAVGLAGKFYVIQVNDPGNKVTIAPYTGPTGTLMITCDNVGGLKGTVTGVRLTGKYGEYIFDDCGGQPVSLPTGKYEVYSCCIEPDIKGNTKINVYCSLDPGTEIKAGEQTNLNIGGKITAEINPSKKEIALKPGSQETLGLVMKLGGKTEVYGVNPKDDQSFDLKVRFLDAKGSELATTTAGST